MLKEFKAFALKGNLIEIAVAFILAVFFAAVVQTFIGGIIMPFVAAIVGKPNFDALTASVGDGVIAYGTFLTAAVNFVIVAFVLFLIVKAVNRLQPPPVPTPMRDCPHCLTSVPASASRCSACTSQLELAAP